MDACRNEDKWWQTVIKGALHEWHRVEAITVSKRTDSVGKSVKGCVRVQKDTRCKSGRNFPQYELISRPGGWCVFWPKLQKALLFIMPNTITVHFKSYQFRKNTMQWKQTLFVGSKKDVYDNLIAEAMLEHFKHFSLLSFLTPGILLPTPGFSSLVKILLLNHSTSSYLSKHIDMGVGGPLGLGFGGMLGACQLYCTNRSAFQNFCSFWSSVLVALLPDAGKAGLPRAHLLVEEKGDQRCVCSSLSTPEYSHTHRHTHKHRKGPHIENV